ncbi:MAG TPA: hypothetical protein VFQ05_06635 [Candidatus Eisenbacteria bacterium]|nr:hypothetical protein [Candidatus Eisenbacteria bacterium]
MPNPNATDYGSYYWCAILADTKRTEVYVMADKATTDGGTLTFWQQREDKPDQPTVAFAPGKWLAFYAASCMDGHAVAVEHWPGQIAK